MTPMTAAPMANPCLNISSSLRLAASLTEQGPCPAQRRPKVAQIQQIACGDDAIGTRLPEAARSISRMALQILGARRSPPRYDKLNVARACGPRSRRAATPRRADGRIGTSLVLFLSLANDVVDGRV